MNYPIYGVSVIVEQPQTGQNMETSDGGRKAGRRVRFSLDFLETHEGTRRLEGFSDGIFTIAATLLVLDIRVPPGITDPDHLINALIRLWPNILSYGMSFLYLGVFWSHHFHIFKHFKRTDHVFLKLNLLFLMMIALLPFPTALLAEYLRASDGLKRIAVWSYSGTLFVTSSLFVVIWLYAIHKHRLVDQDLDDGLISIDTRVYSVGPIGYAVAFLLAFWSVSASLALILLISLYYITPSQVVRFY